MTRFLCVCLCVRACERAFTDVSALAFADKCGGQRLTMGCLFQTPTPWIKVSHWTGNLIFFATLPGGLGLRILLSCPSQALRLQASSSMLGAFSSMLGFSVGAVGLQLMLHVQKALYHRVVSQTHIFKAKNRVTQLKTQRSGPRSEAKGGAKKIGAAAWIAWSTWKHRHIECQFSIARQDIDFQTSDWVLNRVGWGLRSQASNCHKITHLESCWLTDGRQGNGLRG